MKECYCFVWKKAIFGYFLYVNVGNSEDSLENAFCVLSSAETQQLPVNSNSTTDELTLKVSYFIYFEFFFKFSRIFN